MSMSSTFLFSFFLMFLYYYIFKTLYFIILFLPAFLCNTLCCLCAALNIYKCNCDYTIAKRIWTFKTLKNVRFSLHKKLNIKLHLHTNNVRPFLRANFTFLSHLFLTNQSQSHFIGCMSVHTGVVHHIYYEHVLLTFDNQIVSECFLS